MKQSIRFYALQLLQEYAKTNQGSELNNLLSELVDKFGQQTLPICEEVLCDLFRDKVLTIERISDGKKSFPIFRLHSEWTGRQA